MKKSLLRSSLLLSLTGCLQLLYPIDQHTLKDTGIRVTSRGGEANGLFLLNIDAYTTELLSSINCPSDGTDDIDVVITKSHGSLVGYYWYYTTIEVTELTPNNTPYEAQLSAYGHELIRWACWKHLNCKWYQDDVLEGWTGDIGEYWQAAETISLKYL
jgi:hypothetical protein